MIGILKPVVFSEAKNNNVNRSYVNLSVFNWTLKVISVAFVFEEEFVEDILSLRCNLSVSQPNDLSPGQIELAPLAMFSLKGSPRKKVVKDLKSCFFPVNVKRNDVSFFFFSETRKHEVSVKGSVDIFCVFKRAAVVN